MIMTIIITVNTIICARMSLLLYCPFTRIIVKPSLYNNNNKIYRLILLNYAPLSLYHCRLQYMRFAHAHALCRRMSLPTYYIYRPFTRIVIVYNVQIIINNISNNNITAFRCAVTLSPTSAVPTCTLHIMHMHFAAAEVDEKQKRRGAGKKNTALIIIRY